MPKKSEDFFSFKVVIFISILQVPADEIPLKIIGYRGVDVITIECNFLHNENTPK